MEEQRTSGNSVLSENIKWYGTYRSMDDQHHMCLGTQYCPSVALDITNKIVRGGQLAVWAGRLPQRVAPPRRVAAAVHCYLKFPVDIF